ncbi:MAG: hypothetical protein JNM68_11325 [Dinghuibacter sp.]|nr:hypothetical protein [Dinghuibacter sp.]
MKSKFCIAAILSALTWAAIHTGSLKAQVNTEPGMETATVTCDPLPTVICSQINSITYYGKYIKGR